MYRERFLRVTPVVPAPRPFCCVLAQNGERRRTGRGRGGGGIQWRKRVSGGVEAGRGGGRAKAVDTSAP